MEIQVQSQQSEWNGLTSLAVISAPIVAPAAVSLQDWADRITDATGQAVEKILDVGRLLLAAKKALRHGEWDRLFKGHPQAVAQPVRFSRQTAFRLMTITMHPILSNVTHVQHLPLSWGTLYELTKLPDDLLTECLKRGLITPETTRTKVADMRSGHLHPDPFKTFTVHFQCDEDLQDFAQRSGLSLTADTKSVWFPPEPLPPSTARDKGRPVPPVEILQKAEVRLRRYATEIAAELGAPLKLSEAGRIESGVWWLPSIPSRTVSRPPVHRCQCPTCGHMHADQRAR